MRLIPITLIAFMLAGCAPYASYPPIENTAAVTDPTFEPVPTVITKSIEWAQARESSSDAEPTSAFLLPVGTSNKAYAEIEERIPGTTRAAVNESAIGIKSVRVRGFHASVDVSVPREGRSPMLYTLTLQSKPFEQWKVIDERRWRFTPQALERSSAWTSEQNEADVADANGD